MALFEESYSEIDFPGVLKPLRIFGDSHFHRNICLQRAGETKWHRRISRIHERSHLLVFLFAGGCLELCLKPRSNTNRPLVLMDIGIN